ncbi:nitrate ABC transporter substrate-binding protein [Sorangium cellulosum]|uniref:Nitrate ABC transporter substrate-binding protein n=1 Tax=Sorangium cellulosum TaxID=56 RepID=A0A150S621_SORCE|nr:nitrate ABC transporter substrate-binding protein [Sorangium cellulosum]KYF99300.1 nitrate ABC transporter substrate-binding protein [Sorangium cellulosum]
MRRALIILQIFIAALLTFSTHAARADAPRVIRVAFAGVGIGNRPFVGGSSLSVVHARGLLEEEFKKDNIKIEWSFFKGAGPAVNEAYANNLLDFALQGDLPSSIGRAGGLKTKLLAGVSTRQHTYLAVPSDSSISSLADLKGKKVALFKGTNLQLAVNKILAGSGLSERDLRILNMDNATAKAALATRDIDAAFGGYDLLTLQDQGIAKIVYTTKNDSPAYLRHAHLIVTEEFANKYPDVTKRVVKVVVQAAHWIAQNEANPAPIYQLWSKSGTPYANFKADQTGDSLKVRASPLFDEYLISRYKAAAADAKRFGLIRSTFDVDSWIDLRFLNAALKELNLEGYWPEFDANGKVKHPGRQ